jgi:putative hydrolase
MNPGDPSNPLQGLLGDLLKLIGGGSGGTTPWSEAARALAHSVAVDGSEDANPDPLVRIELEELTRVAELHVADATGFSVGSGQRPLSITPVSRGTWALRVLDAWQPFMDEMINASRSAAPPNLDPDSDDDQADGFAEMLGQFALTMGPVLAGMQFGSAAGHLAQRAMGQYALPIPWPPSDELLIVTDNVSRFAEDWSLPVDQTRLWICVHELATHAVFGRAFVTARFAELLRAVSQDALSVQGDLAERLAGDGGDLESLQNLFSDPEALLSDLLSPNQQHTSAQLSALSAALGGYVDHITQQVAGSLTGSPGALAEAWYRYRTADAKGEQAAGTLFGIDLSRAQVERGAAFVRGVIERAGEAGLNRLWSTEACLPTPAEVDAPGLWLERISLGEDGEPPPLDS